jgi:hypothetical protein
MASYWAERAAEARAAGYRPGNIREDSLRRQLEKCRPKLFRELSESGELEDYLQVQVWDDMNQEERLLEAGTDPWIVQELVQHERTEMLEAEEEEEPEDWEDSLRDLLKEQRPQLYQELSASGRLEDFLHELAAGPRRLEEQLGDMDPSLVRRLVQERLLDFLPNEEEEE